MAAELSALSFRLYVMFKGTCAYYSLPAYKKGARLPVTRLKCLMQNGYSSTL
jgi:hypothetical protein